MMPLSTARQFFDDLVAGGTPAIEALVMNKQHENEWLDFKASSGDKEDKATWSEAVCGFGNNQGGVLIWGLDARKDTDGVDAASDLVPVDNAAAHRSRMLELLRGAVEPPLLGVQIEAFYKSGNNGPGYVVCFIPESDTKPHRAENVKNKPYVIRISDNFINPSPSLLRSLFFPKSSPSLQFSASSEWEDYHGTVMPNGFDVQYRISMRNTGIVTAKDLYVVLRAKPNGLKLSSPYGVVEYQTNDGSGLAFPRPVHPQSRHNLCVFSHITEVTQHYSDKRYYPRAPGFDLQLDVYAADMIPLKLGVALGDWDIDRRETIEAIPRNA